MAEVILLLGHGSRDPGGMAELLALADAVRQASDRPVELGVLEFADGPIRSIPSAIAHCAARGYERILAVPLLLLNAAHAQADLPRAVAAGRQDSPGIDLRLGKPFGIQPRLLEILEERIAAVGGTGPEAGVLLVGRGTTDAEANGDVYKIGRLLWERNHYPLVEVAFAGSAEPDVGQGIARCSRLGARRIVVAPYFINTGLLVRRIERQAVAATSDLPGVAVAVSQHLGVHPKLIAAILAQARELAGESRSPVAPVGRTWRYSASPVSHPGHDHHPADRQGDHRHGHPGAVLPPSEDRR